MTLIAYKSDMIGIVVMPCMLLLVFTGYRIVSLDDMICASYRVSVSVSAWYQFDVYVCMEG